MKILISIIKASISNLFKRIKKDQQSDTWNNIVYRILIYMINKVNRILLLQHIIIENK